MEKMKKINVLIAILALITLLSLAPGTYSTETAPGNISGLALQSDITTRPVLQPKNDIAPEKENEIRTKLSGAGLPFIANEGQTDKSVAYYARTFGGTVFVTQKGEIVYALPQRTSTDKDLNHHGPRHAAKTVGGVALRETFSGAHRVKVTG